MHRAAYRFFNAPFVVETDSAAFLAQFDLAYESFKSLEEIASPVYRVMLAGEPAITVDGQTWRSTDPEALGLFAYNAILNAATARVRSHFLFHAAAVATPVGRGVILAGGAGLGKTTLTLALLARGFRFFSDDVAAVGRTDSRVYPFPRRLGLRVSGERPGQKRLIDIAELAPGSLSCETSCPARFLFLLADPAGSAAGPGWYLLLDRVEAALLADLGALPGVQEVSVIRDAAYPALRLTLGAGELPALEPAIQAACRRHNVLLFEITAGPEAPPDFSGEPKLIPLPATEAAQALLRHLKGGPRSTLLHCEFRGSAARLYLALADLAARMACYRLRVGRLNASVELIMATTSETGEPGEHVQA